MKYTRLIEYVANKLLNNQALAVEMNSSNWLHLSMLPVEARFPCLVHNFRFNSYGPEDAFVRVDYAISVWVIEFTPARTLRVSEIISEMFEDMLFRDEENGIVALQVYPQDGAEFVRTGKDELKRFDMPYIMKLVR